MYCLTDRCGLVNCFVFYQIQFVSMFELVQVLQDVEASHGLYLSHVVRKPTFCICENKDAYQLRGNLEADQRLCFRYIDSTIPLLSKSKISSL